MKFNHVLTLILCFILCAQPIYSKASITTTGNLYINNRLIECEDPVYFDNVTSLLPFRTIMESLGATVIYDPETSAIELRYGDNVYICSQQSPNPSYMPECFYIKNKYTNKGVFLNPSGYAGSFMIINDRVYLYHQSMMYLLTYLGCDIDVDYYNYAVYVYNREYQTVE